MNSLTQFPEALPARWTIEWDLCDIAAKVSRLPRDRVSPTSRMIEDLGLDSLCFLEFLMEVESRYQIYIPNWVDEVGACKQVFTRRSLCLRDLAEVIEIVWPNRGKKLSRLGEYRAADARQIPNNVVDSVPFLQLDGRLSENEWMRGELYESLGVASSGVPQFRRRTDGMRSMLIPTGTVMLGSGPTNGQADADERPAHTATVTKFLIDAEVVSTTAYARFLNSIGSIPHTVLRDWFVLDPNDGRKEYVPLRRRFGTWHPLEGTEREPMILVSWFGANAYSLWANLHDWRAYRGSNEVVSLKRGRQISHATPPMHTLHSLLPSEAQWEYAARGPSQQPYSDGNEARMRETACVARHTRGQIYSAGCLPMAEVNTLMGMSPFGLHHMAGNVWQWCRDWYDPSFYATTAASVSDPQNDVPTGVRSERGGSWVGPVELSRSAYRRGRAPEARGRCLGFRCIGLPEKHLAS